MRGALRLRGWGEPTDEFLGADRDKGHFMAHCIGGGLDVNVFSQERRLNRGWSLQGRILASGEHLSHCPGNFLLFASNLRFFIAVRLHQAVIFPDQTLWVEVFDNYV